MSHPSSASKHPKELWLLALTELCERFAFWGVGNLLVIFLIEYYQVPGDKASQIYGIFTGFAAFLPIVGGWIADRWRHQLPMLLGAVMNAGGCFLLASGIEELFYVALFIICCGYGIFTPSILAILGHTYRHKPALREAGFSIYYASINVGVFLALLTLGISAQYYGWRVAFAIAGAVQTLGLIPLLCQIAYHKELMASLQTQQKQIHLQKHPLTAVDKQRIWVIAIFFFVSILFWAAYNQGFSSMEIFVHSFMNKTVAGYSLPDGVFLSSESFFLILLAPLLAFLYAWLQKKKWDPSPAVKTALSLFAMAACFWVMVIGSKQIPSAATSASVSYTYILVAYFLMAVAEMLLAPIGLAMVSDIAPPRYTALAIGMWYVCVGIAFFSGGMIASLMDNFRSLSQFFSLFVLSSAVPGVILWLLARKITKMSHLHMHRHVAPDQITL